MKNSFDGDRRGRLPGSSFFDDAPDEDGTLHTDEHEHEVEDRTRGARGHTRATPRFVAPPPGAATGDSVLDPPPARARHRSPSRRLPSRRLPSRRSHTVDGRRRQRGVVLALVVLLAIGGGVFVGGRALLGQFIGPDAKDFAGGGRADVVVQVADGDTTGGIGRTLVDDRVVGSVSAFTRAASKDTRMGSVQPGYYRLRTELPASDAVSRLVDPASRVGSMVIPGGRQLDDVKGAGGIVTPGILSLISKASCVELDGERHCTSVQDLRTTATAADPAELGVPDWATAGVVAAVAAKERRLEGLIRPGSYDIEPGSPPTTILKRLITRSATAFDLAGLPQAKVGGLTPYQLLIVASLNEREVKPGEYAKVTRVILNRLAVQQKLEFDSTVNYPLDVQAMATTPQDRAAVTPWNTYASPGLPLTPIASPSDEAIEGAEHPAVGNWRYFVTCGTAEATCFSQTYEQHLAVIAGHGPP
ncbi:MAG: endolytic transglycosylase MltG [Mycobacteriaceae bacterium]